MSGTVQSEADGNGPAPRKGSEGKQARTAAKYYAVSRSEAGELVARISPEAPVPMPPEAIELLGRIAWADNQVANSNVVSDPGRRLRYANELLSYAQTGLQFGDLATASTALSWFERRVADAEGPEVRRRHLLNTLWIATWVGIPCIFLGLLLPHLKAFVPSAFLLEHKLLRAAVLLAAGNCLGIVFFAFFNSLDLRFDQLAKFDPANLDSRLRFIFVWIITVILGIFLLLELVVVGLNGKPINGFLDSGLMALILGILCGYSDGAVSKMLAGILGRAETSGEKK